MKGTGAPQRDRGGFAKMRGIFASRTKIHMDPRSIDHSAPFCLLKTCSCFSFAILSSPLLMLCLRRSNVRHGCTTSLGKLPSCNQGQANFFAGSALHLYCFPHRSVGPSSRPSLRVNSRPKTSTGRRGRICLPSRLIPSNPPLPKASPARLSGNTSNP